MKNKETLTNIKSNYCMKFIFTFLEYNYILKLVKYNKKFQKILDISLKNYKERNIYLYSVQKYKPELKIEYLYEEDYEKYLSSSIYLVFSLCHDTKGFIITAIILLGFFIAKQKIKERYKMINRIVNIILLFFFAYIHLYTSIALLYLLLIMISLKKHLIYIYFFF
jgi:hypothetical protein